MSIDDLIVPQRAFDMLPALSGFLKALDTYHSIIIEALFSDIYRPSVSSVELEYRRKVMMLMKWYKVFKKLETNIDRVNRQRLILKIINNKKSV
jgi:hypothetical protein